MQYHICQAVLVLASIGSASGLDMPSTALPASAHQISSSNTVSILPGGGGSPDHLSVPLQVELVNSDTIRAFQFEIRDTSDYLQISSIVGINRAAGFSMEAKEISGSSRILGINLEGDAISPGSGPIVEVIFKIAENAPVGSFPINLDSVILADPQGLGLINSSAGASFNVTLGTDHPANPPARFSLSNNYPNPFNANTTIQFELAEKVLLRLQILDLNGREIRELAFGYFNPGTYEVVWDATDAVGRNLPSGIYLSRLVIADNHTILTHKLLLLK